MRIAFILGEFPCLSETFVLNQITGLLDRGHKVDIYADYQGQHSKVHADIEKYNLLNCTYYRLQVPNTTFLRVLTGVKLLLTNFLKNPMLVVRSLNIFRYGKQAASLMLLYAVTPFLSRRPCYDIVHCHFGPNGLKGLLLQDINALQGKLITTFHGYDVSGYLRTSGDRVYNQLFDKGNLFLPISEHMKHQLVKLGCDEKKITVHRMGIDCSRFSFTSHQLRADSQVQIVTVARLVEKKGVEFGIRAVAKLIKGYQNVAYKIIGDGYLREDLEQLIQDLDAGDVVRLLGWRQQQEVIEILKNSDILLAPSITSKGGDQEGTPVVLMEAMAMGLPIVSTLHSGIPELVKDGISGFLVPERDIDALAEKLGYLVEHPEIWPEMGQASRAYVEEHYGIDKLNDQLVKIYQHLLRGQSYCSSTNKLIQPLRSPSDPSVSVIIPVFNDLERLKICLQALENQTYPKKSYEVIVVDNGSDESIEGIVSQFAQATATYESRPGSYVARNKGISLAKGEVIAFTDADCIPALDWIEKGVASLLSIPSCGLVAGKIELFFKNSDQPTPVELYESLEMSFLQERSLAKQNYGVTANLFTFKGVIDKVGFFDDTLKSGGDRQWGQRVFAAGYKQIYADDVYVAHPARHSFKQLYKRVTRITGGRYDLMIRNSKSHTEVMKDLFEAFKPPFRSFFRIWANKNLQGNKQKIQFTSVMLFVRYVTTWERVRLQLGGKSRRD